MRPQLFSDEELIEDMDAGLGTKAIAEKRGVSDRAIRWRKAKLTRQGFSPEHDLNHRVPDGMLLKGASTLYGAEGEVKLQWVKSNIDLERQFALFQEAVMAASEEIPPVAPVALPAYGNPDLLNLFVLTDYHLGMLAWGEESGENWDVKIAEDLLVRWFAQAIASAPKANTAILAQLGDFLHWDGLAAVTPMHNNVLDADIRFQKLTRIAIRVLRQVISMLLVKYPQVHIICAEGNHDMASSIWLRELLTALYEDEPRVDIDRSPDPYYCYEFGEVSLFFHHGHLKKLAQLQQVMAAKFRETWGRTKYSYVHTGHLHENKVIETPMMKLEQHPTLAAKDAYASRSGYLSQRNAVVITYHAKYGEVGRLTITPEMVRGNDE